MRRTWFDGPEFEWLASRVATSLWMSGTDHTRVQSALVKQALTLNALGHHGAARDLVGLAGLQQAVAPAKAAPPRAPAPPAKKSKPLVPPVPPKPPTGGPAMSVAEYNAWRGESPHTAAVTPYVYQSYPKWVYFPDGRSLIVETMDEHRRRLNEGWFDVPVK